MLMAELSWSFAPKDLSDEQYAVWIANWPTADKKIRKEEYESYSVYRSQRVTLEEAAALQAAGIAITLQGVDGTMLTKMKDRNPAKGDVQVPDIVSGAVVQLSIPDLGLLQIDEVDWTEDCCTEELQARLDNGWRILAVCPPNAQRRPDYILGRRKAQKP